MTFLERSADFIIKNHRDNLSSLCVVLPNKRASLFLRSYLAKHIEKPFFTPQFYTIETLAQELSGLMIIDNINLLFLLYEVHKSIEAEQVQDFDQFMKWGNVLIADFNDIDKYLVDASGIFSYLSETKVIEKWNLGEGQLSDFELNYLRFFNSLYPYYKDFTKKLSQKKQGYQGLASRTAIDKIAGHPLLDKFHQFLFIGFNALTVSEEKIIKTLFDHGKADILWDADEYYMNNEVQEAGKFLRNYRRKWNLQDFKWIEKNFETGRKNIDVIGIPKIAGQAKVAGELISTIPLAEQERVQNAIVLADETLLLPMLNSIPKEVNSFNVTMGLGLDKTPLFTMLDGIMAMHENAERLKSLKNKGKESFFTRDFLKILKHPYTRNLEYISDSPLPLANFIDSLNRSNKVFITASECKAYIGSGNNLVNTFFSLILQSWEHPVEALHGMLKLVHQLRDILIIKKAQTGVDQKLDIEYLYAFSKVITSMINILETYQAELKLKTLRRVFNSISRMSSLPFYGEPLHGIQIMGMLETRALDFERVILLSANEGILPTGKNYNSFIPYDIRREFNLPTFREKDSIFAYHFYRLLQRARDITLIYNTESDALGGGDKSRFITQMLYELKKKNPDIRIRERLLSSEIDSELPFPVTVSKTEDVLARLQKKALTGFSPSSINTFIRCPLKFYFMEIMKIGEAEEIEENIDAATMGKVIHQALNELLKPMINKNLINDPPEFSHKDIKDKIEQALQEHFKGGDTSHGKNYLISKVAVQFVRNFFRPEVINKMKGESGAWFIRHLEQEFRTQIPVQIKDKNLSVLIKGTIDRVDEMDGKHLVIDYKTGQVKSNYLKINSWEEITGGSNYAQALQLLIYAYLLLKNSPGDGQSAYAGIIALPKPSQAVQVLIYQKEKLEIDGDSLVEIETLLQNLFIQIFDPDTAFSQTEELDNCDYCPFQNVCGRG